MHRTFVLSTATTPLMPCHPARARQLLKSGKAAVFRRFPFTIILKQRKEGDTQPLEFKVDPGSKTTGIALVLNGKTRLSAVFGANLNHRGQAIKDALESRRAIRRSRRFRKTRYRPARFLNRTRPKGWLPPSLQSRVDNVAAWQKKLFRFALLTSHTIETVRFDIHKMSNPEISGKEYQQGTLFGYEVREYLLEKFQRTCIYCGKKGVPLQIDHIYPKSKGGTDRVSNLTLACKPCNIAKGNQPVENFLKDRQKLKKILAQAKSPLKDAAAVNATRFAIGRVLKKKGIPTSFWSGGRTKHNRIQQGYPKDHWIDAVCVGETGEKVHVPHKFSPLFIKATGRGTRQMCRVNKFGFPRTSAKSQKRVFGFQTGDQVKATVAKGKKKGSYAGRVAVRKTGNFNITTPLGTVQGISFKNCLMVQRVDGYGYSFKTKNPNLNDFNSKAAPPPMNEEVSAA